MKIAIASDHAAVEMRTTLAQHLREAGHDVTDLGCPDEQSVDYPQYAEAVARAVSGGAAERGVALCGTGIGMSMAANKVPGVRAALVCDPFTTRMSREHNDANVLCMGARVIETETAWQLLQLWLETEFAGDRHARRVEQINQLDTSPNRPA
ncbi:MAG: ribose 5-phosphate isomerase B [Planctomycetota bacterium]|nr:ribose 5-phosphate isomerase B [Planctomycetota bacterium]